MKKRNPEKSNVTPSNRRRSPRNQPASSAPTGHPATGQVLSEVEGGSPYHPKRPRQKTKRKKKGPAVTIAPSLRSSRDVFINRPGSGRNPT
jgi:hypothetical protein